jgi:Uma2 family endonuclease
LKAPKPPRRKEIRVGPNDDGRRMTLADFDEAIGEEGYIYELNKGVVEVSTIPHPRHFLQMSAVRDQLIAYKESNPGRISAIVGGGDTKVLIESEQSERHPDIAVYTSPMPDADEIGSIWVPTIAVEIVSERSAKRDYEEKPGEYLAFGIDEYWIVDASKNQMLVMTRYRGEWKERIVKPSQKCTSWHLPGFSLDLKRVLAAGKEFDPKQSDSPSVRTNPPSSESSPPCCSDR